MSALRDSSSLKPVLRNTMTSADAPSGYSGETVSATDAAARVLAMRRSDGAAAYLWVQNRDHTWANAASTPSPISPAVTIGGLQSRAYTVEVWSPYTGTMLSSSQQTPTGGLISVGVSGLSDDVAVKVY